MAPVIRVLMIDDDTELAAMFKEYLETEGGFDFTARHDGLAGAETAEAEAFDVIVLDVMMPKLNGFEVLKRLRQTITTPIIMLTARGDDLDRILGLEVGADDYVPKPCNLRELVARIRAILRRSSNTSENQSAETLTLGDVRIDTGSQTVYRDDRVINMTGAEYAILLVLVTNSGDVVSKDDIAKQALGRRIMPYDRSIDAHIGHIRKKLGPLSSGLQRIKTVRGKGYLYVR